MEFFIGKILKLDVLSVRVKSRYDLSSIEIEPGQSHIVMVLSMIHIQNVKSKFS